MFGQPRFQAHAYPPNGGCWWEGKELKSIQQNPFFGRTKELETLEASLVTDDTRRKLTVIKGIGGIGKTELLLQFAASQKSNRNVFFLTSYEGETFDSVVSKLSTSIGFEMIQSPAENQERWRNTPVSERVDIFMKWLGQECNKDSLFIIDDIEVFGYSKIPTILQYPAHHTLISTRDSNLKWTGRSFQELRLPPVDYTATMGILKSTLAELSHNPIYRNGLDRVARRVQGHPLAARNAMSFITERLATYDSPSTEFSDLFDRDDPEERKTFLKFRFEGRSLWGTFDLSLKRLALQENHQTAVSLLQILPFLCVHDESVDDFFKMDKYWLRESKREFVDIAMLKSSYMVLSTWLSQLRSVSFYLNSESYSPPKALNIHPLISQYMLLRIDEQRRVSLMRQVLYLFYFMLTRKPEAKYQIMPHVQHCFRVCQGLGVSLNSLNLPEGVTEWAIEILEGREKIKGLGGSGETGGSLFDDSVELLHGSVDNFVTLCFGMREKLQCNKSMMAEGSTAYKMMVDCKTAYKEARRHIRTEESVPKPYKLVLVEAITVFEDMVRSRSMYPEFIVELEGFKRSLQKDL